MFCELWHLDRNWPADTEYIDLLFGNTVWVITELVTFAVHKWNSIFFDHALDNSCELIKNVWAGYGHQQWKDQRIKSLSYAVFFPRTCSYSARHLWQQHHFDFLLSSSQKNPVMNSLHSIWTLKRIWFYKFCFISISEYSFVHSSAGYRSEGPCKVLYSSYYILLQELWSITATCCCSPYR